MCIVDAWRNNVVIEHGKDGYRKIPMSWFVREMAWEGTLAGKAVSAGVRRSRAVRGV